MKKHSSQDASKEKSGELEKLLASLSGFTTEDLESIRDYADAIIKRRKDAAYQKILKTLREKMGIRDPRPVSPAKGYHVTT